MPARQASSAAWNEFGRSNAASKDRAPERRVPVSSVDRRRRCRRPVLKSGAIDGPRGDRRRRARAARGGRRRSPAAPSRRRRASWARTRRADCPHRRAACYDAERTAHRRCRARATTCVSRLISVETRSVTSPMKIALLQINPTVGDLAGNARLIADAAREAGRPRRRPRRHAGARAGRLPAARSAAQRRLRGAELGSAATSWRASSPDGPPMLVGLPEPNPSDEGRPLFNTRGAAPRRPRRAALPQGAAADLRRLRRGPLLRAVPRRADPRRRRARALGISICEDIWNDRDFWKRRRYHHDPVEELVRAGAEAIVNLSASPFSAGKHRVREEMLGSMARKHRRAARLREPVRRQRRPGVRRPQLRASAPTARRSRAAASFEADVVDLRSRSSAAPIGPPTDLDAGIGDLARAGARHARLRAQVRLRARRARAVRRHRLGADRGDRRRGARRRQRARRADAVALLEPRQHRRFAGSWPRTSASRR